MLDREDGGPVVGALVRISAPDGGVFSSTISAANGEFSLPLPPGDGPFSLRAEILGYTPLTALVAGGAQVVRDLRLGRAAIAIAGVTAVAPRVSILDEQERRTPGGNEAAWATWYGGQLPTVPGDLAGIASLEPGVHSSGEGLSFFGQDPSQTRFTLDGAGFGATSLPPEALGGVTIVPNAYDVSRGRYSGGMVAARTLSGTDLFGGAVRARLNTPLLQWSARPDVGGRQESTFGYLTGGMGGELVWNRLYWYTGLTVSRRSAPLTSLENADPKLFARLGVDPDSAVVLRDLLREREIGPAVEQSPRFASSDGASGVLRLDYFVSPRHDLMLRLDGRSMQSSALGGNPLATVTSRTSLNDRAGGVLAELTSRPAALQNVLRVYRSWTAQSLQPRQMGPSGIVNVPSSHEGSGRGSSALRFGGSPFSNETRGSVLEISNELTGNLGKHQWAAGIMFVEETARFTGESSQGSFTFSSLEDFRANRPALFTRTLGTRSGGAAARYGALYLGDTWSSGRLAMTYGVRLERRSYGSVPASQTDFPSGDGVGEIPSELGISPRLGWRYSGDGWDLRGGAGEFRGVLPIQALASALSETGSAGPLHLTCVGDAAPVPQWHDYTDDPESVPSLCRQEPSVFADQHRPLTRFDADFAAPRTWRASIGGSTDIFGMSLHVDASLTRGLAQPLARDANLRSAPVFMLSAEDGRPVYAAPAAIDPMTGRSVPAASRANPEMGIVRALGSQGRSTVTDVTVQINGDFPRPRNLVFYSAAYTFTRARDDVGSLPSLFGTSPIAAEPAAPSVWATSDRERRHHFQARILARLHPSLQAGFLASVTSGIPFTPLVAGDVNADGVYNDPAFVFGGTGSGVDNEIARLIDVGPKGVRSCLARQLGRVAARNSCTSGWTPALELQAFLAPKWYGGRLKVELRTSNAISLLDRALHGATGLRGWGEPNTVDPYLLRVRSFDPVRGAFGYEVNPSFGTPRRSLWAARPFSVRIEARVAVGADPAKQPLQRLLARTTGAPRTVETLRRELSQRIPNLPAQVVSLDSIQQLALTDDQRDQLLQRARGLAVRLAPLADSVAITTSELEAGLRDDRPAAAREIRAFTQQIIAIVDEEADAIQEILTPDQWRSLPEAVRVPSGQFLPAREFEPFTL